MFEYKCINEFLAVKKSSPSIKIVYLLSIGYFIPIFLQPPAYDFLSAFIKIILSGYFS
jgi:hypothetical protein